MRRIKVKKYIKRDGTVVKGHTRKIKSYRHKSSVKLRRGKRYDYSPYMLNVPRVSRVSVNQLRGEPGDLYIIQRSALRDRESPPDVMQSRIYDLTLVDILEPLSEKERKEYLKGLVIASKERGTYGI